MGDWLSTIGTIVALGVIIGGLLYLRKYSEPYEGFFEEQRTKRYYHE